MPWMLGIWGLCDNEKNTRGRSNLNAGGNGRRRIRNDTDAEDCESVEETGEK